MTAPAHRRPPPIEVVCNTGPIIALSRIGRLDLLRQIIPSIRVPSIVVGELKDGFGKADLNVSGWLETIVIQDSSSLPDAFLSAELDAGEAAVITLAKELNIGVLMDERKGRRVAAEAYGLMVIGTGRILLEAKNRRLIGQIRPLVEQMRAGGYYLSERLMRNLCREAGELDETVRDKAY